MVDYKLFDLYKGETVDKQLKISFDGGEITNSDLHQEQFELTESLCSESQLVFGSCEASEVKFRISNVFQPLKDKWLTITEVLNGNEDEPFQFGRYKVYSDKPTADRSYRDVVAYDVMFDIINTDVASWYNGLTFPMPLKAFRDSFFEFFEIEQEETILVNDDMTIEKTVQPTTLSGKDVIQSICELNGCFGHIGRDGKFQYITLKSDVTEIQKTDYVSADYEDYTSKGITKVNIRENENDIGGGSGEDGSGGSSSGSGGGNCSCVVDSELSATSENPVQNKVIAKKLNEVFTSVSDGKELVASAITDKGIETSSDAAFEEMAKNISKIASEVGTTSVLKISNFEIEMNGIKSSTKPVGGNIDETDTYYLTRRCRFIDTIWLTKGWYMFTSDFLEQFWVHRYDTSDFEAGGYDITNWTDIETLVYLEQDSYYRASFRKSNNAQFELSDITSLNFYQMNYDISQDGGGEYITDSLALWLSSEYGFDLTEKKTMNLGNSYNVDSTQAFTYEIVFRLDKTLHARHNIWNKGYKQGGYGFGAILDVESDSDFIFAHFSDDNVAQNNHNFGLYFNYVNNSNLMLTVSFDGTFLYMYLNGQLLVKSERYLDIIDTYNLKLGYDAEATINYGYFDGIVEDFKVYSKALSQNEITKNYSKNLNKYSLVHIGEKINDVIICEKLRVFNQASSRINDGCIDTGIIPTEKTWFEIGIKPLGVTGEVLFGLRIDADTDTDIESYRLFNYNNKIYWDYCNDETYRVYGDTLKNGEYAELILKNGEVWKNGTQILTGTQCPYFSTTKTMILDGSYITTELYYLKVHENDELIADFIPVIKDGIPSLYDSVNDRFITPSGIVYATIK